MGLRKQRGEELFCLPEESRGDRNNSRIDCYHNLYFRDAIPAVIVLLDSQTDVLLYKKVTVCHFKNRFQRKSCLNMF